MKKKLAVTGMVLVIVVAGLILYQNSNRTDRGGESSRTDGLTRAEAYSHPEPGKPECDAYTATCGLCLGEVIDKECYVDKSKLSPEELRYMGFN